MVSLTKKDVYKKTNPTGTGRYTQRHNHIRSDRIAYVARDGHNDGHDGGHDDGHDDAHGDGHHGGENDGHDDGRSDGHGGHVDGPEAGH